MKIRTLALSLSILLTSVVASADGAPCLSPDNGGGTIDFPPDCPYDYPPEPMMLIEGLPPGTTIELHGPVEVIHNVQNSPGGSLGGEVCLFDAQLTWQAVGTGDLEGFYRTLIMPVNGEAHIGPRNPGDPVQSFPTEMMRLQGELFGDPDFCMLRFRAGAEFGLPSPGFTTLTRIPTGNYAVDSFFDITYQIEFAGCPDSQLADLAGTTTATVRRETERSYNIDWCRLQWPLDVEEMPETPITVYGRLYIAGLTDQTEFNDPVPGTVIGQVGYGPDGSVPSGGWTWFDAVPNPAWNGNDWGEPSNDEYLAELVTPAVPGDYDFAFRFSGNGGASWTYADRNTGVPGEDGSENGYQAVNAGHLVVTGWPCCVVPDNGSGTIDFPPNCPYHNPPEPMMILDGLPPGSTLELHGPIEEFHQVLNVPGGSLGGEICTFDAQIDWNIVGTGDFGGFNRHIVMPVSGEIHIAPRLPGDPIQAFECNLVRLEGELFGDPDFCTMRVRAGAEFGLPSPGHTLLTELPSGDFAVDSFFDIFYEIEFEGCPGGQLEDLAGTTADHVRRFTCEDLSFNVDWCRLQWPLSVQDYPGTPVTVYGRLYIAGLTDQTIHNDPVPGLVRGQLGYGPDGSDPSANPAAWTWTEAIPNPGWDGTEFGEPNNDEYQAELVVPSELGEYDYAFRFSGDAGGTWTYADKNTGLPGEDGSENGYQVENAGLMRVLNTCCVAPDNGAGTVDFPADCPYVDPGDPDEPMLMIEGLPPGTTIELHGPLDQFYNVANYPGGVLGGEVCVFDAWLDWECVGTGDLAGFLRHIMMPVSGEIHIGPRTPGDPAQSFQAQLVHLEGELFGDPDFCMLRVRAGIDFGLPSPGYTSVVKLPDGDFAVDSFFDITYQVEFEGCPDSQLADLMGVTNGTVRRDTCRWPSDAPEGSEEPSASAEPRVAAAIPNPFRGSTTIDYVIPRGTDSEFTRLRVFDTTGRLVRVLLDAEAVHGRHQITWDGVDDRGVRVASGLYFYQLDVSGKSASGRVIRLE